MEYYYGWGLYLWPLFLVFLVFGILAWVPRGRNRFYSGYPYYESGVYFPYTAQHLKKRGKQWGRGPRNYRRSDDRVVEDINDRLLLSDEIDATDMEVRSKEGVVTLSGSVADRYERRLAEWVAESVPGVSEVKNELRIGSLAEREPSRAA